ncbi:MauE/DoxX family redox-associated membrane protein [Mucilaginibacter paludis]|uniref:Methylamine utilisation protein MauE domain-containing protein n=1 Tax=Mucilaginibacter paludis DSM 18603 TaxID=714943 RepID=H1XZ95_9SPHI|nr:hypothetical protein Mucpa_1423 [Mucilaginibacter paludis DSM 18603]
MKRFFTLVEIIVVYFLFALFFYTALSKLVDWGQFLNDLARSPIIPLNLVPAVGIFVIIIELTCSALLIIRKTRIKGILLSIFLLAMFTTYIFLILTKSPYIPCSCGGIIGMLNWNDHILLNSILLILASFIYVRHKTQTS